MTRHNGYRTLLARRAELRSADEARLATHLEGCQECRELWSEYAVQDAALRLLALARPPGDMRGTVLATIDRVGPDFRNGRLPGALRLRALALALTLGAAAIVGLVLMHHAAAPTTQTALERKGYVLLSSTASPAVRRATAERIARAFFPGTIRSAVLARVSNTHSQVFGGHGRLCWVVSITPASSLLPRPGGAWLDTGSSSAVSTGSFAVFIDADLGGFVLASNASSA